MISFLIVIFGVTMLYAASTSRIEAYVRIIAFQGFLLFLMVLADFHSVSIINMSFLALETLGFKTIIIPVFLLKIIRKNNIYRELEPQIPNFYSVVLSSFIFVFGFFIAYWSLDVAKGVKHLYFGIAVSTMLTALALIITRKMLVTHVCGYMMLENGIFLLSLSVAKEMPLIVNLGVLLDIFMGIFLLGLFVTRIKSTFEEARIDNLMNLRD